MSQAEGTEQPASDPPTSEEVLPEVYAELHRLAHSYFRKERVGHTLQPTALVHEAYMRLAGADPGGWRDRKHFFCIAARAMRQILVNHARDRGRLKRGGDRERVSLEEAVPLSTDRAQDLLELEDALDLLAVDHERKSRVVELRYFGGLDVAETAEALGISPTTVKSDWTFAKAWLLRRLSGGDVS